MQFRPENLVLRIPNWAYPRWWEVAYLIPPMLGEAAEWAQDLVEIRPDEKFNSFVSDQLRAVVEHGAMPPSDIAPTIMNLADDLASGRRMTIRAGDYIALQNHLRHHPAQ